MTAGGVFWAFATAGAIGWPVALWLLKRRLTNLAHGDPRRRWIAGLAAIVSAAWLVGVWASFIEPKQLAIEERAIELEAWRGAPLRIGVISDVHVGGAHVDAARVRRIVERMNALKPDLVLLAGDYVDHHEPPSARSARQNAEIAAGLAAFAGLEAPLGRVGVLGNHDWWYDGERVEAGLRAADVVVLENAGVLIERPGGGVWIAGLADFESRRARPDWRQAVSGAPEGGDVLGLGHWPDVFDTAPAVVPLTVAGHSHCGQVSLPLIGRPVAVSPGARRWPCGLYRNQDGQALFVSGGVGTSILPVRLGAPPRIDVLVVQAPRAGL